MPDIGVRGENIAPFLHGLKARNPQAFAAVRRTLRSIIPAIGDLDVDLDSKRGTLDLQITQDGTTYSSRVISEGTLRILALCAIAVTATRGLFAFEEPENGVQPQRLDRIAELLTWAAGRGQGQIVVTTHSPGFVAAVLECAKGEGARIGLFSVSREGRSSVIKQVQMKDFGLWRERALDEVLSDPEDFDKVSALVHRGWLDL